MKSKSICMENEFWFIVLVDAYVFRIRYDTGWIITRFLIAYPETMTEQAYYQKVFYGVS